MKRGGFTLIEVSAVIVIMGIIAGSVVLSLLYTKGQREYDSLCSQFVQTDLLLRSTARHGGARQRLIYDLNAATVFWPQGSQGDDLMPLIHCSHAASIEIRTTKGSFSNGQVLIDYSSEGYCQTYALGFTHPSSPMRWLIVPGMTTPAFWTGDPKQVDDVFAMLNNRKSVQTGSELSDAR